MRRPRDWRTPFVIERRTLVVSFPEPRQVLSSAVCGGGVRRVRHVVNHQVDERFSNRHVAAGTRMGDPARDLRQLARALDLDGPVCGMMTAVSMNHAVLEREAAGELWVEGILTVGVANAVRVGEPIGDRSSAPVRGAGTINMILVTNARLSPAALIGTVMVATEGKTAALLDAGVRSWTGRPGATGTGTDAIVVVNGWRPSLRYSGTHTKIGELFGRVVRRGVERGLRKAGEAGPRKIDPTR